MGTITIYTMFPIIFCDVDFNLLLGFIVCFIFNFFVCLFLYFCFFFMVGGAGEGVPKHPNLLINIYNFYLFLI